MNLSEITELLVASTEKKIDVINSAAVDIEEALSSVQCLADIPTKPLEWVWPGWIPCGTLTLLGGHVGEGKSTVTAALVAALTNGTPLPDEVSVPPVNVLILSAGDDPARIVRPRLEANNADLSRVFVMDVPRSPDACATARQIRTIIDAHGINLIVIDPLGSLLRRSDRASEGDLRNALQPLLDVIASTGVAALGLIRVSRLGPARRPAQRLVGSSAIPAIARSVLMLARSATEDVPDRALLQVVKGNYAIAPKPVALQLAGANLVRWLGPADDGIDELAESASDRRLSSSEREDAANFLREYLAEEPVDAITVLNQAKKLGFSEITIRRAKKDAGIVSFRGVGWHTSWLWRLPDTASQDDQAPKRRVSKRSRS